MHDFNRMSQRSGSLSAWLGLLVAVRLQLVIGNAHRVAFVMVSTDTWPIPRRTTFVKRS